MKNMKYTRKLRNSKRGREGVGICQITKKEYPLSELAPGSMVVEPILSIAKEKRPDWNPEGYISISALNKIKHEHVRRLLESEKGELTHLEKEVLKSFEYAEIISRNIETDIQEKLPFGARVADMIAVFGGSWWFILSFLFVIFLWIFANAYILIQKPFDPFPFILLNLILSCIAAIQAPVIMMSQNRQESKDRTRSEHDYQVNLKAELEIKQLHEKLDFIIIHQIHRILDIQEIQTDLLEEVIDTLDEVKKKKDA